jgi:uncharacterized DUF497 family protein
LADSADYLIGFEWDDININHLGERGVSDREVEMLVSERYVIAPNRRHPHRRLLIGRTHGGRTLLVSIEPTPHDGIWRPITARDAEPEEAEQLERRLRK